MVIPKCRITKTLTGWGYTYVLTDMVGNPPYPYYYYVRNNNITLQNKQLGEDTFSLTLDFPLFYHVLNHQTDSDQSCIGILGPLFGCCWLACKTACPAFSINQFFTYVNIRLSMLFTVSVFCF